MTYLGTDGEMHDDVWEIEEHLRREEQEREEKRHYWELYDTMIKKEKNMDKPGICIRCGVNKTQDSEFCSQCCDKIDQEIKEKRQQPMTPQPTDGEMYDEMLDREYNKPFYNKEKKMEDKKQPEAETYDEMMQKEEFLRRREEERECELPEEQSVYQEEKKMDKKPVRTQRIANLRRLIDDAFEVGMRARRALENAYRDGEQGTPRNVDLDQEDRMIRADLMRCMQHLDRAYDKQP